MKITPKEFADALGLSVICHAERENERCMEEADICRPGLQFAGYFDIVSNKRPQVIGKTEMAFLNSLPCDVRKERLQRYFSYHMPLIVIARGMECPEEMARQAQESGVPIYRTEEETSAFSANAMNYLSAVLAPRQTCHGVLVDIYGVGVMITGESGVGKSECGLELIKHGHQLVADDVVDISRVGPTLFGESPETVRNLMELRGIGIVDVKEIFGIGAILRRKRVELVVHLELWTEGKEYDRLGRNEKTTEILGVELPMIELPVRPGRSLATIVEIAARNWRLKTEGYNAVDELDRRLRAHFEKLSAGIED